MIINHNHKAYLERWNRLGPDRYNGAFYYSQEICENIIPKVNTDRNWLTVDWPGEKPFDHAIAFVHHNLNTHWYADWKGKDVVLVCGLPETVFKMQQFGNAVYLPLSVNVKYLQRFKNNIKQRDVCFAGRPDKITDQVPDGVDILTGLPREQFLTELAKYRHCFAVGRVALECLALGVEVLPYDPRFPDPTRWKLMDNAEAARKLNQILKEVDGGDKQR